MQYLLINTQYNTYKRHASSLFTYAFHISWFFLSTFLRCTKSSFIPTVAFLLASLRARMLHYAGISRCSLHGKAPLQRTRSCDVSHIVIYHVPSGQSFGFPCFWVLALETRVAVQMSGKRNVDHSFGKLHYYIRNLQLRHLSVYLFIYVFLLTEVGECLLSFCAESFVFLSTVQKYEV